MVFSLLLIWNTRNFRSYPQCFRNFCTFSQKLPLDDARLVRLTIEINNLRRNFLQFRNPPLANRCFNMVYVGGIPGIFNSPTLRQQWTIRWYYEFPCLLQKLRNTPLQACHPIVRVPINWNHIQNQLQKETGFSQVSHKKNIEYFPLNPGCLLGIHISWFI